MAVKASRQEPSNTIATRLEAALERAAVKEDRESYLYSQVEGGES